MNIKNLFLKQQQPGRQVGEQQRSRPVLRLFGSLTGISTVVDVTKRAVATAADDTRKAHAVTAGLVADVTRWTNPGNYRTETFAVAYARHGLSDKELAARLAGHRLHAQLATAIFWLFLAVVAGSLIGWDLLWAINGLAGAAIFGVLALNSWFRVRRIERREFYPALEFFRYEALRCLNVLAW